jgi:glutamate N-acetyltransferase / amino-acid N-acetyltransferase
MAMACGPLTRRLMSAVASKAVPFKTHLHFPPTVLPAGYVVTGVYAGVKKRRELDLALIISTSERPTTAAASFTQNAFKAAPVLVSEQILADNGGRARAVIVNSGCANAVTGQKGLDDAWTMAREVTQLLSPSITQGCDALVMSTGVIGQTLPISKITSAIQSQRLGKAECSLGSDVSAWERAARAFMTTDTFPKLRSRSFMINGVQYCITGMDKGAGMIHPNMGPPRPGLHATLLGCLLTDAAVSSSSLQSALNYAVERSFNCISVDGDMSTNDSIIVLANGAKAEDESSLIDENTTPEAFKIFQDVLTDLATELAQLVVRDGEGATKFVRVAVKVGTFWL